MAATQCKRVCDPKMGRNPPVENHWSKEHSVEHVAVSYMDEPGTINHEADQQSVKECRRSYQGVVELEGTNIVGWNVGRCQRFRYLGHDAALICEKQGWTGANVKAF